jgi:hypothetical protein
MITRADNECLSCFNHAILALTVEHWLLFHHCMRLEVEPIPIVLGLGGNGLVLELPSSPSPSLSHFPISSRMASQRKPMAQSSSDVFNHSTPPQFIAPFSLPPLRSQQFPPGVSHLSKQVIDEHSTSWLRRNVHPNGIPDPGPSPTSTKSLYEHGLSPEDLASELRKEP